MQHHTDHIKAYKERIAYLELSHGLHEAGLHLRGGVHVKPGYEVTGHGY